MKVWVWIETILGADSKFAFQSLCLKERDQSIDHIRDIAFHNAVKLMNCETNAVVSQTILREVISADLLASIAGSNLRSAVLRNRLTLLFQCEIVKT